MVDRFSPENGAPERIDAADPGKKPGKQHDAGHGVHKSAGFKPRSAGHTVEWGGADHQGATVVRALAAANQETSRQIVNPYLKVRDDRPKPRFPDAFKMMMDPKYRAFHARPQPGAEPSIPPLTAGTGRTLDAREQRMHFGGALTTLAMRKYLNDAYFKVDSYNFVTVNKHRELLKAKNAKIRPPEDISAHGVVLFSDPTKTMLVSPRKLVSLNKNFAEKRFEELNIGTDGKILQHNGRNRHEILLLSPKGDQVFALQDKPGKRTFKPHQIFVAVDDEQGRHYVDLRALIADRKLPPLSRDTQSLLKKIVEPETRAHLSRMLSAQPENSLPAKRPAQEPERGDGAKDTIPQPAPAKRSRSDFDDRPRDKVSNHTL